MLLKAADIGSKAMIISALAVQIGKGTPMRKIDRWKLSTLLLVCALLLTILYSRSPSISLGGEEHAHQWYDGSGSQPVPCGALGKPLLYHKGKKKGSEEECAGDKLIRISLMDNGDVVYTCPACGRTWKADGFVKAVP